MTREEYRAKPDALRGDAPDISSTDSEDHFWSLVLGFDEAIVQGSPLPSVDAAELAKADAERLQGIRDCLTLLAQSRSYYHDKPSRPRSAAAFADTASPGERRESIASSGTQIEARFGRFELVRKLGEGGAGMVYLANDPKLNRKIALKIPLPAWLLTNDLSQRFVREARLAAQLTHPNIVSVYEVGEIAPICYIASEYCAGQSLAVWLSSTCERVKPRTAAELVASLCDAVQYAHAHGVLHRDIKPSNILLAETGGSDQERENERDLLEFTPKIGDFGLAKLMDDADDLTRSGAILGTLHYLTPEQADGRVSDISVQTDVYALGAILYELITGRPVHQGSTTAETLRCILLADIVPPRRLRPEVPADLNAICLKALQRSPGRRYATAAEFREDLLRFLQGKPIIARDTSTVERVYLWVRRRPALAALWLVSLAALIALVTSTMVYNNRLVTAAARLRQEVNANHESLYVRNVQLAGDAWRLHHIPDAIEALQSQVPATDEPDRRDFTWKYLWNQCHTELATLVGHDGDAYCVAFSPDGKLLASAGKDATVRLWDLSSNLENRTFRGHQAEVNTVAFVSDRQLASASDDGTVRLWDVNTGQLSACLDAKDGPVFGLAITKDGQILASGGGGARIRLWSVANGEEIWSSEPTSIVEGLAIASDTRTLISGHSDSSVRCWNIAERKLTFVEPAAADTQLSVASSPDVALFAIASRTGALATYRHNRTTWNIDASVDLDPKAIGIHALAFSPRDNTLATGTRDGLLEAWNIGQKYLVPAKYLPGHRSRIWSVAWSADGRLLASSSATGEIKLWNPVSSGISAPTFPRQPSPLGSLAVSSDSGDFITTGDDGRVRMWSRKARQVQRIFPIPPKQISLAACPPNDPSTAIVASLRQVQQFNLGSGSVSQLAELPEMVRSLAISTDGRIAAIGCEHTTAMLFDAHSWRLLHRLKTRTLDANCVALSSDGRYLATAGVGPEIEVWNTSTAQPERVLPGNFNRTTCIAFLPDSVTLVSGGTNEEICFWDVQSGQSLAKLIGRPSTINAIAVSPDGRTLATGSAWPAWVDLWDTRTKSRLVELENFAEPILALTFTPDGNSLVAGTTGGTLVEWSINPRHVTSAAPATLDSVLQHTLIDDNTGSNDGGAAPASSRQCMDRLQAVNEYARRNGFVAGYPTFRAADDDATTTIEAVLVHPQHTKTVRVSLDECAKRPLLLQSDYRSQSELLNALLAQANQWGVARGYKGALPTGFCEADQAGSLHYEFAALFRTGFVRQRMPAHSVDELKDIPRLFRKVHQWSVDAGFVSGFPAGQLIKKELPCVVLTAAQAEIQEVPIAQLIDPADPASP